MTTARERDPQVGMRPIPVNAELIQLFAAYERALDEHSEATSAVYERIRRRTLPTTQEFVRKRAARATLLDARRAFWKATRRSQRQH